MVVEPDQRRQGPAAALEALADAGVAVAAGATLTDALVLVAEAAARAGGAEVCVVRVLDPAGGTLSARAVAASAALAAELEGTRIAGDELVLVSSHGLPEPPPKLGGARVVAARALAGLGPVDVTTDGLLPPETAVSAALPLGRPAVGVLQLLFPAGTAPGEPELAALGTFGVRAAHALRAGAHGEELASELERTRTLLAVVGQATAEL